MRGHAAIPGKGLNWKVITTETELLTPETECLMTHSESIVT